MPTLPNGTISELCCHKVKEKKMAEKKNCWLVVLLVCFFYLGCSGNSLTGTYVAEDGGVVDSISFNKDGTCAIDFMGYVMNFDYKVAGNRITVSVQGINCIWIKNGDVLTAEDDNPYGGELKRSK
jgi:hypothetical protein